MEKFSFKRNLKYMGETFYRPKSLIDNLLKEESLFYFIFLPLFIFTVSYESLYIIDYLTQRPLVLPIKNLLRLLTTNNKQYYFYQMILFPLIHIVDFVIFWVVLTSLSKLFKNHQLDTREITFFSIFTWNTIGLIALFGDIILLFWPSWWILTFLHPLCGLIGIVYGVIFIHKQIEISKGKAFLLYIISWTVFVTFRMLFLG